MDTPNSQMRPGGLAGTNDDLKTDELLINMGPQHPSTHGVLRVVITTDGEYDGLVAAVGELKPADRFEVEAIKNRLPRDRR